jgi:hypothetical protein
MLQGLRQGGEVFDLHRGAAKPEGSTQRQGLAQNMA